MGLGLAHHGVLAKVDPAHHSPGQTPRGRANCCCSWGPLTQTVCAPVCAAGIRDFDSVNMFLGAASVLAGGCHSGVSPKGKDRAMGLLWAGLGQAGMVNAPIGTPLSETHLSPVLPPGSWHTFPLHLLTVETPSKSWCWEHQGSLPGLPLPGSWWVRGSQPKHSCFQTHRGHGASASSPEPFQKC